MESLNITETLFIGVVLLFLLQSLLWINLFVRISPFISSYKRRKSYAKSDFEPTTLIISARNEAENLQKNLPFLLRQGNEGFNIIVVDDGSTDDTYQVLKSFESKHSVLKVLKREHLPEDLGKREALKMGIEAAKTDVLLFSDADCQPKSHLWVNTMQFDLASPIEIILGYSPVTKSDGWVNKLARYDVFTSAFMYMNLALWGYPYMAVGRNLMFRKSLFESVGGYGKVTTASGDDDLLLQKMATKDNVGISIDENTFTYTHSAKTYGNYIRQKARQVKTSIRYKWYHQLWLGFTHFASIAFYFVGIYLIFQGQFLILPFFLMRWVLWFLLVNKTAGQFKEKDLLPLIPLLDVYQLVTNLVVLFYSPFVSKKKW